MDDFDGSGYVDDDADLPLSDCIPSDNLAEELPISFRSPQDDLTKGNFSLPYPNNPPSKKRKIETASSSRVSARAMNKAKGTIETGISLPTFSKEKPGFVQEMLNRFSKYTPKVAQPKPKVDLSLSDCSDDSSGNEGDSNTLKKSAVRKIFSQRAGPLDLEKMICNICHKAVGCLKKRNLLVHIHNKHPEEESVMLKSQMKHKLQKCKDLKETIILSDGSDDGHEKGNCIDKTNKKDILDVNYEESQCVSKSPDTDSPLTSELSTPASSLLVLLKNKHLEVDNKHGDHTQIKDTTRDTIRSENVDNPSVDQLALSKLTIICTVCQKGYKYNKSLQKHMYDSHPEVEKKYPRPESTQEPSKLTNSIEYRPPQFRPSIWTFFSGGKRVSTSDQTVKCNICKQTVKSKHVSHHSVTSTTSTVLMFRHIRETHPEIAKENNIDLKKENNIETREFIPLSDWSSESSESDGEDCHDGYSQEERQGRDSRKEKRYLQSMCNLEALLVVNHSQNNKEVVDKAFKEVNRLKGVDLRSRISQRRLQTENSILQAHLAVLNLPTVVIQSFGTKADWNTLKCTRAVVKIDDMTSKKNIKFRDEHTLAVKDGVLVYSKKVKSKRAWCMYCTGAIQKREDEPKNWVSRRNPHEKLHCLECFKLCKSMEKLEEHRRTHFQCDQCDNDFKSKFLLVHHMQQSHNGKKFKCESCKKVFKTKQERYLHTKSAHLTCKFCGGKFGGLHGIKKLQAHYATKACQKEAEESEESGISFDVKTSMYLCHACSGKFKRVADLRTHDCRSIKKSIVNRSQIKKKKKKPADSDSESNSDSDSDSESNSDETDDEEQSSQENDSDEEEEKDGWNSRAARNPREARNPKATSHPRGTRKRKIIDYVE